MDARIGQRGSYAAPFDEQQEGGTQLQHAESTELALVPDNGVQKIYHKLDSFALDGSAFGSQLPEDNTDEAAASILEKWDKYRKQEQEQEHRKQELELETKKNRSQLRVTLPSDLEPSPAVREEPGAVPPASERYASERYSNPVNQLSPPTARTTKRRSSSCEVPRELEAILQNPAELSNVLDRLSPPSIVLPPTPTAAPKDYPMSARGPQGPNSGREGRSRRLSIGNITSFPRFSSAGGHHQDVSYDMFPKIAAPVLTSPRPRDEPSSGEFGLLGATSVSPANSPHMPPTPPTPGGSKGSSTGKKGWAKLNKVLNVSVRLRTIKAPLPPPNSTRIDEEAQEPIAASSRFPTHGGQMQREYQESPAVANAPRFASGTLQTTQVVVDDHRSSESAIGQLEGGISQGPLSPDRKKPPVNKQSVMRPLVYLPAFVPNLLKDDISTNHTKYKAFDVAAIRDLVAASQSLEPGITEFQGAVMIADVKGFTQLTEILSKRGTSGVELLTTCMNAYFSKVINMILSFGGDVIKFAGDSLIVSFYPNDDERRLEDAGLRAATQRCVACAHQLATKLGHMRMKPNGQVEPAAPSGGQPGAVDVTDTEAAGGESDLLRRNNVGTSTSAGRRGKLSGSTLSHPNLPDSPTKSAGTLYNSKSVPIPDEGTSSTTVELVESEIDSRNGVSRREKRSGIWKFRSRKDSSGAVHTSRRSFDKSLARSLRARQSVDVGSTGSGALLGYGAAELAVSKREPSLASRLNMPPAINVRNIIRNNTINQASPSTTSTNESTPHSAQATTLHGSFSDRGQAQRLSSLLSNTSSRELPKPGVSEAWQSKFQELSSQITERTSGRGKGPVDAMDTFLTTARGLKYDTVQEEGESAHSENGRSSADRTSYNSVGKVEKSSNVLYQSNPLANGVNQTAEITWSPEGYEPDHRSFSIKRSGPPAGAAPTAGPVSESFLTDVLKARAGGQSPNDTAPHSPYSSRELSSRPATPAARSNSSFMGRITSLFSKKSNTSGTDQDTQLQSRQEDGSGTTGSHPSVSGQSNSFGSPLQRVVTNMAPERFMRPGQTSGPRDTLMDDLSNSTFSLKIMVSAGSVCVFHIGGYLDEAITDPSMPEVPRWEFFIGDRPHAPVIDAAKRRQPIIQIAEIEHFAEAGEVVASREVVELIGDDWDLEGLEDGSAKVFQPLHPNVIPPRGSSVTSVKSSASLRISEVGLSMIHEQKSESSTASRERDAPTEPIPEPVRLERDDDETTTKHEFSNLPDNVQRRLAGLLRMHLLGAVRVRVEAGHLDFVNEIRPLTVMFLGFPSLSETRDNLSERDQVASVQFMVQQVQATMRKWDGSFLQFRCDEKGFVAICAFGLPGHTHEDIAARGIHAALELLKRVKEGKGKVCIGVTTGDLLCACVGARRVRSEYTVFGDAINLSARLMCKCKSGLGEVLCDEHTYTHAKYKAKYEELQPLQVRGRALPVMVYRVSPFENTVASATRMMSTEPTGHPERKLIGRKAELDTILQAAAKVISGATPTSGPTGATIIVEGNTGMGKTKLLSEVRHCLEKGEFKGYGVPGFIANPERRTWHLFAGVADTANKSQKLHPWRRIFLDLFLTDTNGGSRRTSTEALKLQRRKMLEEGMELPAAETALGNKLAARIPIYNTEWRKHLAELLDIPQNTIPTGKCNAEDDFVAPPGTDVPTVLLETLSGHTSTSPTQRQSRFSMDQAAANNHFLNPQVAGSSDEKPGPDSRVSTERHTGGHFFGGAPQLVHTKSIGPATGAHWGSTANLKRITQNGATIGGNTNSMLASNNLSTPEKKYSLNFMLYIFREFIALYGPTIILLENLHDFDTWSWQLLVKVSETLINDCLILATTRPNDPPSPTQSRHLHGKAALYQKVAMMYKTLLKQERTISIRLEAFNFKQTKELMREVGGQDYPEQYVQAVMEKTGGMPLYIEKVTEFLSQKPWIAEHAGNDVNVTVTVNRRIWNLNFQQVIMERMDRLKPGIHLTLKVASVMGQWVDLEILHKFYPITKSLEELRSHLLELERGNFLKNTDTENVWEFNMVERDIVYNVIPHYQRRRLHAKLAQELENTLLDQHVSTLTTIAYHWNQACASHESTEVECALKAIEYWQKSAKAAYDGSALNEALRLYQKASSLAEVLCEHVSESMHGINRENGRKDDDEVQRSRSGSLDGGGDESFTVGGNFKGKLNWDLISRICRAEWEKQMASCCLGIVLQHRYELNGRMEYWETEDYFLLLTEHAIRGLMLLGAPHPSEVLAESNEMQQRTILNCFGCCGSKDYLEGWHNGLVLTDREVDEIREILLILIIAAQHHSMQSDDDEYTRLLMFCKRVCKFFNKCCDTGLDPFVDIKGACSTRIKSYKASRGMFATQTDLDYTSGPAQRQPSNQPGQAMIPPNPRLSPVGSDLSRAVLGRRNPMVR